MIENQEKKPRKKPERRTVRTPTDSRKFQGVWLPAWIYLDTSMGWTKKILWLEIDSLDNENGCTKRNKGFADFLGVSERMVSKLIGELVEEGRVYMDFGNGTRVLHSRMDKLLPKGWNKSSGGVEQKFQGGGTKVPNPHIEGTIKETNKGTREKKKLTPTPDEAEVLAYCRERGYSKRFQDDAQIRHMRSISIPLSVDDWKELLDKYEAGQRNGAFWGKSRSGAAQRKPAIPTTITPGLIPFVEQYEMAEKSGYQIQSKGYEDD